jgi:hypothetical protein
VGLGALRERGSGGSGAGPVGRERGGSGSGASGSVAVRAGQGAGLEVGSAVREVRSAGERGSGTLPLGARFGGPDRGGVSLRGA